jgi:hypothetical protein
MGWWNSVWKTRAEDWVYGWLGPEQVPPNSPGGAIVPDTAYLNVFLKSARVVDVRKGLSNFYGVVHSFIKLAHPSLQTAEFNVVATPTALRNVDERVDRVVQINQRLLGPTPYRGGDLEIEVGLFSVPSCNMAGPYLSLLENLSNAAGVCFISTALPFIPIILEGMKLLTGGQDIRLEIGLSITEPEPRQGYCVVLRAPKDALPLSSLRLDPVDFRLLDSNEKPIASYPYLVLEVQAQKKRADWFRIPDLAKPYSRIQEYYREGAGRTDDTEAALQMFRRIARTCDDLIMDDANEVADRAAAMYRIVTAKGSTRGGDARPAEFPDLEELNLYS